VFTRRNMVPTRLAPTLGQFRAYVPPPLLKVRAFYHVIVILSIR